MPEYFGFGFLALLALGIIGSLCERYRLAKCPKCEKGRLHEKRQVLQRYREPGHSYKYGIRSVIEVEKGKETTYCDKCDHKAEEDFEKTVAEWIR